MHKANFIQHPYIVQYVYTNLSAFGLRNSYLLLMLFWIWDICLWIWFIWERIWISISDCFCPDLNCFCIDCRFWFILLICAICFSICFEVSAKDFWILIIVLLVCFFGFILAISSTPLSSVTDDIISTSGSGSSSGATTGFISGSVDTSSSLLLNKLGDIQVSSKTGGWL